MSTSSTSTIHSIIDAALADYTKLTGTDLSRTPFAIALEQLDSPEAVLQLFHEREKTFNEYRDDDRKLIKCLSPAVKVLQAFSNVRGEAVSQISFPPSTALFAAIGTLLDAANGVSSSYDALLELFECLGSFLKRMEIYTTIPPTPIMTEVVVKIMMELLSVLALALKQIKQGRFKKFTKKLLGESEIETVLRRLDRLTQDEARVTVAQTLGVVHGLMGNIKVVMEDGKASTDSIREDLVTIHQTLNKINKTQRDQLQKEVHQWLSPPDPSTNQNFVSEARHGGTAAWFFESKALSEWKAGESLLWIHGKPGAGKSTLLSAIIQEVERMHVAGLATMAYYYFDFRDVKKQDCDGLLSSLIFQLSAESDSCYNTLSRLYSDNSRGIRKPSISALKKCLKDMLSIPGKGPIYIIVDALDECPNFPGKPSAREKVLDLIEELVDLNLSDVHLCVASRPEMDIRSVLGELTNLKFSLHDEIGQKEDMIKYIESVVRSDRSMRRWKGEDKQLVVDTLSSKAAGMFRWVVCQVDRLRRTFPINIRKVLDDLPKTLDETYGRTLLNIDEEKREFAQRLFRCLTVSIRPLHVDELAEILAIQFDEVAPPTFNPTWRPENAEEAVISACSSLIAIVDIGGKQIVQFTHFSVKEYLTSERLKTADEGLSYYHVLPESAHATLAHASLSVLLQLDDQIDRNTISHFPLAPYAARYWTDHAKFKDVTSQIQEVIEGLFNPAMPYFAAWVWLHDIDHHWIQSMSTIHPTQPEAMPLYYASLCGFPVLTEHLITAYSPDVNSRGGFHTTALHAASVKGHFQVASLLLKNGADPDSRDHRDRVPLHRVPHGGLMAKSSLEIARLLINSGADVNVTDEEGCAPLHAAARYGCREIAELLLGSSANLDARNKKQETPLGISCYNGKPDMARFLIDRGSDINSRDENGSIPLHAASQCGHVDIARLLLDCGSDVNARSTEKWTPLLYASGYKYLDLARLLVDRGADVNAQREDRQTSLHQASACGDVDLTRLLLDHGADVNARAEDRQSPLHFASGYGYRDVARLLIDCGADVNAQSEDRWTPLHYASGNGYPDLTRLLIERGADVNVQEEDRLTPLHQASGCGHLVLARLLIDHGADVNTQTKDLQTPLHYASGNGYLDLTLLLIDSGADVNAQEEDRQTPLHFASGHGYLDLARLFLDRGADVNAQDKDCWTSLHLASSKGLLDTAKLLIDRSANIDGQTDKEQTPLALASYYGHLDIARFLIEKGAAVSAPDKDGDSPFHMATYEGHVHVMKFLLECGVDVDIRNGDGYTALHLASTHGKLDVVRFLIDNGSDNYAKDNDGWNPLHLASYNGYLSVVQQLIDSGIPIDVRGENQQTPLALASSGGKADVGRFLIERGAELNVRDDQSEVPLHIASQNGHLDMTRLLLDRGADPNIKRDDLSSPLHLASANGHLKVAELLVQRGADVVTFDDEQETPLYKAGGNGHVAIARLLIEHGANVHSTDSDGRTPLHTASHSGHLEVVKLLLRRDADVDVLNKAGRSAAEFASENGQAEVAKFISEYKTNPNTRNKVRSATLDTVECGTDDDGEDNEDVSLHAAAEEGNIDTLKSLLEREVDINARNENNETPLDRAAVMGHVDVVRLLIERGAEVDSRDMQGWTPLHSASRFEYLEVSRALLDHGANVNARQQDNWTPMHFSANGNLEIVKLLLERGADINAMSDEGQTPYDLSLGRGDREIADLLRTHGAGRSS